jgi:CYTH domain-containing protein
MPGGIEIERKFLVDRLPGDLDRYPSTRLEQGYVAIDPSGVEVRIRRRGGRCTLTVKGGRGLARAEEELELEPSSFERLWPLTEGRRIEKTRYVIPAGEELTIELDVYHGPLAGLVTAEVEFASAEAAERFTPPEWFGLEVTEADEYKNRRLAIDGLP